MIKISVKSAITILSSVDRSASNNTLVLMNYYRAFGIESPKDVLSRKLFEGEKEILHYLTDFQIVFGESSTFEDALQVVFSKELEV